jgi:hypothetical protein
VTNHTKIAVIDGSEQIRYFSTHRIQLVNV